MQYQFCRLTVEGDWISSHDFDLPDDESALTKARELAAEHDIEIWKGRSKIGLVFSLAPIGRGGYCSHF